MTPTDDDKCTMQPDSPNAVGLGEETRRAAALKVEIDELEQTLAQKKGELVAVSETIKNTLELIGLDNVRGHGFLFFKETKESVKTPKSLEDKRALFAFLEERGMFDEIVSVNSQTLNSLYKSLSEQAQDEGNFNFRLPGVEAPTAFTTLKMRKAK